MNWLRAYLETNGYQFDCAVNALTGGARNQTVSLRAALGQRAGRRGWCLFCAFLSLAVQRNHCALQLAGQPSPSLAYVRAGIAFAVAFGLLYAALRLLLGLV